MGSLLGAVTSGVLDYEFKVTVQQRVAGAAGLTAPWGNGETTEKGHSVGNPRRPPAGRFFEAEGTTYTQFVLRQRLDRAYRLLRDTLYVTRSISSIAYEVGFGDLSYFNRTFRRRSSAAPSDVRSEATGFVSGD